MTFSLLARCPRTGAFGVVISSSTISVASRCAWVRAGVGAVVTQNITDPRLGPTGLDLMQRGLGARATCEMLVQAREFSEFRQLAVIDEDGRTAHFTGARGLGIHAVATGEGCIALGNLLKSEYVVQAMVNGYLETPLNEPLAERLLCGLEAGFDAGAEATAPVRAAGMLVADSYTWWPTVDLRVDWHEQPIRNLRAIWEIYRPEIENFIARAINPTRARTDS